jgi:hypothetical protein
MATDLVKGCIEHYNNSISAWKCAILRSRAAAC